MLHSPAEVAAFLDGETRLVAAAWRNDAVRPPFVLHENGALEHRQFAKEQLRCVFQDCPSPALTTVHRARGRDGFRHLSNGDGHGGPESFHHVQGKAVVAAWLRQIVRNPGTRVEVEHGIDTQRTRVADVALVSADRLHRVAFEIQYAPITADYWLARHRDYVAAGIDDVWLFGHTRLRRARGKSETRRFAIAPVHEEVIRSGKPLFFPNPELGLLAVAVEQSTLVDEPILAVSRSFGTTTVEMLTLPLADVRVNSGGVVAPQLDQLREARARHAALAAQKAEANAREDARRMAASRQKWLENKRQADQKWLERKRQADQNRLEGTTAAILERDKQAAARGLRQADRRERQIERGQTVLCTRCWYPLSSSTARAGQHSDCSPPAEGLA